MKKPFLLSALLLFALTAKAAPVLFFSDLESGPKAGGENNKGVYVCVFGTGFGATRGTSHISVGSSDVDNYPVWGSDWLGYQKSCFQLGAAVSTGNIVMTTNDGVSNGLPFTVRSGNIYFVSTAGNDSANGSFATPWLTPLHAKGTIANGDTIYLRAGSYGGTTLDSGDGASSLYMSGNSGTALAPKAMLGYPGETATIACSKPSSQCDTIRSAGAASSYWTFAELDLTSVLDGFTHYIIAWENGGGGDGIRWVGNKIHGAFAVNVVWQGSTDVFNFLGNDDYEYWSVAEGAGSNERGYGIYFGGYGTQQNVNVLHNRFKNTQGFGRGNPDTFNEHVSTATTAGTAVTWVSGDKFAAEMVGHGINFAAAGGFVVASFSDDQHITLTASAGNHTATNYYSGGISAKGLQVYAHCPHDCGGSPQDHFKNFVIANNQFLNNCMEGMAIGGTDGADGGANPWDDSGILYVYNNLVANNGACDNLNGQVYSGLQIGDCLTGMNAKVWNNTFYLNAGGDLQSDSGADIYFYPCNETFDVTNNIFFAQPNGAPSYTNFFVLNGGDGTGGAQGTITGTKNDLFSNGNSVAIPSTLLTVNTTTDPVFVANGTDFHIQTSSPAKNGGSTLAETTPDMDGCTRPQNSTYARGVFEFPVVCSASPPPPATIYFRGHR